MTYEAQHSTIQRDVQLDLYRALVMIYILCVIYLWQNFVFWIYVWIIARFGLGRFLLFPGWYTALCASVCIFVLATVSGCLMPPLERGVIGLFGYLWGRVRAFGRWLMPVREKYT